MVYKKGRVGRVNHLVLYADLALRTTIAISIRFLFIYSIHILKWPSKIRNCFFIFVFLICQLSVIKFYYSVCTCVCVLWLSVLFILKWELENQLFLAQPFIRIHIRIPIAMRGRCHHVLQTNTYIIYRPVCLTACLSPCVYYRQVLELQFRNSCTRWDCRLCVFWGKSSEIMGQLLKCCTRVFKGFVLVSHFLFPPENRNELSPEVLELPKVCKYLILIQQFSFHDESVWSLCANWIRQICSLATTFNELRSATNWMMRVCVCVCGLSIAIHCSPQRCRPLSLFSFTLPAALRAGAI